VHVKVTLDENPTVPCQISHHKLFIGVLLMFPIPKLARKQKQVSAERKWNLANLNANA
jgi:hypothetical protein